MAPPAGPKKVAEGPLCQRPKVEGRNKEWSATRCRRCPPALSSIDHPIGPISFDSTEPTLALQSPSRMLSFLPRDCRREWSVDHNSSITSADRDDCGAYTTTMSHANSGWSHSTPRIVLSSYQTWQCSGRTGPKALEAKQPCWLNHNSTPPRPELAAAQSRRKPFREATLDVLPLVSCRATMS